MISNTIIVKKEDGIYSIELNRPESYNAFNAEMAKAVQAALIEAEKDAEVRCVTISGIGKGFCSGQDLKEIMGPGGPEITTVVAKHYNPIISRIRKIEKPVLALVNGIAAGAGANIALACDITIAKKSAYFMQAFCKIGLIPDSGGTFTLPRLVGWQRAAAYMMLAEKISADEAMNVGMIYKSVPDEEFESYCSGIVGKLSKMPTRGLGLTKRALNYSLTYDLDKQLAIEEQLQYAASQTEDYAEGVNAFLEKRKAVFKGK